MSSWVAVAELSSLCDPEIPHHAAVLMFEDVAVVGEVAAVVAEGDGDLDALAGPDEDGVAEAGVDDSGFDGGPGAGS